MRHLNWTFVLAFLSVSFVSGGAYASSGNASQNSQGNGSQNSGGNAAQNSGSSGNSAPQTFTYQGRFFNASGTLPLNDVVNLVLDIYDPSGTCLLYEEQQNNLDLTGTNGLFSVQVGSKVGDPKRGNSDPGLSMSTVFANAGTVIRSSSATCPSGYTPTSGDARYLRVTVTPHTTGIPGTITPDQIIESIPSALVAQSLQGVDASGFIQSAGGVSGQGNVSLASLMALTAGGTSDASALHNHDSLYVKLGSGAGSNTYLGGGTAYTSGNFGIGAAVPTADLGFGGTISRTIQVERNTVTNASGNNLTVSAGGATSGGTNQAGGSLVLSSGISTGTGGSSIQFKTASGGASGSADQLPSTKMVLTSAGLLGLGTTNPLAQLEIDLLNASTKGTIIKGASSQSSNLLEFQNSSGSPLSYFDASGYLTLPGSPTANNQAATMKYVNDMIATVNGAVTSFNSRTGAVTLTGNDVKTALGYTPVSQAGDTLTGSLILNADPTANLGAATKQYVTTALANKQPIGNYITALTGDVSASGPGSSAATVNSVGGSSAANLHSAELLANTATATNTPSALVARDPSGNFSAGTISANLVGNVTGSASNNVLKSGDTMSGLLVLSGDPTTALGAATKQYVDSGLSSIGTLASLTSVGTITSGVWNAGAVTSSGTITAPVGHLTSTGTSLTTSGNVGIGTASPSSSLTVNGAISQYSAASANLNGYLQTNASNQQSTSALNPGLLLFNSAGYSYGLDVGYNSTGRYRSRIFAPDQADIAFATVPIGSTSAQSDFTELMTIQGATGHVGIGTTSPSYPLDVAGTANVTGFRMPTSAGLNKILVSDGSGNASWQTVTGTLSSVGDITAISVTAPLASTGGNAPTLSLGTVGVANGGTGLTSGTSGGVPYFSATGTMASSAALGQYGLVLGGGVGAAPSSLAPSATSGLPLLSQGSSANPAYGQLNLASSSIVTGTLGVGNGGTGTTTSTGTGSVVLSDSPTLTGNLTVSGTGTATTVSFNPTQWGVGGVGSVQLYLGSASHYIYTQRTLGTNIYDIDGIQLNGGNVGIGTSSAANILQVGNAGRLRISNGTSDYSLLGTLDSDGTTNTRIVVSGNTRAGHPGDIEYVGTATGRHIWYTTDSASEKMRLDNSGNLGIGTNNPTYTLDVAGTGRFTGNLTTSGTLTASAISGNVTGSSSLNVLKAGDSMTGLLNLTAAGTSLITTGNVGINTSTPNYTLDVNGSLNVTGAIKNSSISYVDSKTFTVAANSSAAPYKIATSTQGPSSATLLIYADTSLSGHQVARVRVNTAFSDAANLTTNVEILDGDWSTYYIDKFYVSPRTGGTYVTDYYLNVSSAAGAATTVIVYLLDSQSTASGTFSLVTPTQTALNGISDQAYTLSGGTVWMAGAGAAGGNGMMLRTTGNVGIGTTTPNQLFEIAGTGARERINGGTGNGVLELMSNSNISYLFTESTGDLKLYPQSTSNNILLQPSGGNVGIGTSSPTSPLHVFGNLSSGELTVWIRNTNTTARSGLTAGDDSGTKGIAVGINNSAAGATATWGQAGETFIRSSYQASGLAINASNVSSGYIKLLTADTERMRLDTNGNVGIGTSSPTTQMHVYGKSSSTAWSNGTTINSDDVLILERPVYAASSSTGRSPVAMAFRSPAWTSGADWFKWDNDNVDIAKIVATPMSFSEVGSGILGDHAKLEFFVTSAATSPAMGARMTILGSGNVGIGTTTPGYLLQVGNAGDGSEARANAWNTLSDERLKKNFEPLKGMLSKINQLGTYYYNWKQGTDTSRKIGLKAQEVEKIFPEVVSKGKDGFLSLSYQHLIAPVIAAIQELYQESLGHTRELASLKAENAAIKAENASIKTYLCSKDPQAEFCKSH